MNKKMLTILATTAMIASLASCSSKTDSSSSSSSEDIYETINMKQATTVSFDADEGRLVADKEGCYVRIKNVQMGLTNGTKQAWVQFYDAEADGSVYLSNCYGLELELAGTTADLGDISYTDKVNLTGKIETVNGKAVLKEAEVQFVSEGDGRNYYFSTTRTYIDYMSTPQFNGLMVNADQMQVVDVPTVTTDGGTLKVVCAGEDTTNDDDNDFIVDVKIPGGLTETQVSWYNGLMDQITVGDGLGFVGHVYYNGGYNLMLPTWIFRDDGSVREFTNGTSFFAKQTITGVYTSYTAALAGEEFASYDTTKLATLDCFDCYSYAGLTDDYYEDYKFLVMNGYTKNSIATVNAAIEWANTDETGKAVTVGDATYYWICGQTGETSSGDPYAAFFLLDTAYTSGLTSDHILCEIDAICSDGYIEFDMYPSYADATAE